MTKRVSRALLAILFAGFAFAQSSSITGTVADPTGKVIPGAAVRLTSELNGEVRSASTDENGDFAFNALGAAAYTVRVEAPGFRPIERKGNNVLAASRLALGTLQMEVGTVSESISVEAQGQSVATTTTSQEAHLDQKQVAMISIRGRDPMSMLRILPGVQQGVDQDTFGSSFATAVPAIMGQTNRQTVYVDGLNGGDGGNGGGGGGNFSDATNIDAIAEVDVKLNNYTAEYGLKGGPQINLVTKHGGQAFHGTAYWYKRHEMFNATNFFNNAAVPKVNKPVYRYQTLGGTLGGPVKVPIPIINPGGKKMFFFYSLDDTRLKDAIILRKYTMPTELERAGNFSQTKTPSGALIVVKDPTTGLAFPGNIIPANRSSSLGLAMLNILPKPNALDAAAANLGYNWINQEPSIPHPRQQNILRVDLRPTDRDTISIKYQKWWTKSEGYEVAGASSRWGLVRTRYDFTSDDGKVEYTKILSSHMVNEFSIGIHYTTENGPPASDDALAGMERQNRGLGSLKQIAPANNPLNIIPKVSFGTLQNNSNQAADITYDGRWPITGADTSFPIRNDLTYTRGVHTFKFGGLREFERFGQARSGNFGGTFDFSNDGNDPLNTGFAFANTYIGHVTSYTEDMGRVPDNFYQATYAFYAMDSWKARRNLTFDIGLRAYRWGLPLWGGGEASAFSFDRFDPKWGGKPPVFYQPTTSGGARRALNPLTGEILPSTYIGLMLPGTGYSCGPITPKTPCSINGIVVQNDPTYTSQGKGFYEGLGPQLDPRFGFAWDPFANGKMAVRGSFGAFHQATGGGAVQGGGPAFKFGQTVRYTDLNSYFLGVGPTSPVSVSGFNRTGQKQPVTYNYTFAIQKDIGWHTVLDIAYVGNNTHHIAQSYNYNALPAGIRFRPSSRDNTVTATAANPGALPDIFLRPIQGFGDITISGPATTSRYDSLQVQANRRFARGFELAAAYTYAGGTSYGFNQNNPLPSIVARSRLAVQKQVLNLSYVVDLPHGSKLMPGKVSRMILDDWQVSGVTTFANGLPSDVSMTTTDNFDFSGGGETCGIVQTGNATLARDARNVNQWFNTAVFQRPIGRGDLGNNCNNAKFILPGFNNHDVSVFKSFHITEKKILQFRAEAYNLLNHTQFNAVNTSASFDPTGKQTNTQFGRVTSARNERRMQFSLRFSF